MGCGYTTVNQNRNVQKGVIENALSTYAVPWNLVMHTIL